MRARSAWLAALALALALTTGARAAAPCSAADLVAQLPDSSLFGELLAALADQDAAVDEGSTARRRLTSTTEQTFRACPRIAAPVCSKDGRNFLNDCVAANAGAEVECQGRCPCREAAAASASAGVISSGPVDPVMGPCPRIYTPVCGTDGRTYSNVCVAGGMDNVACSGHCPCRRVAAQTAEAGQEEAAAAATTTPGSQGVASGEMGRVDAESGRVSAMAVACPAIFAPVCGDDNQTYSNACMANAARAAVVCSGECPCKAEAACIDTVEPACSTDGVNYTNTCFALVAGAEVACMGTCPCGDVVAALESSQGGTLIVPTDDALLAALDALNGTAASGDWLSDAALLRQLLARHTLLTEHQRGQQRPLPSLDGMRVVTEAGQRLDLYDASRQAPGRVQTVGTVFDQFAIEATRTQPGCNLTLLQIDGVLAGPKAGQ